MTRAKRKASQRGRPSPRTRTLQLESGLVAMTMQPLPLHTVRAGLPHQLDFVEPVKFALDSTGRGCAIAELVRAAELHDCEKLVGQALDSVEAWIEGGCPAGSGAARTGEQLADGDDDADAVDTEIAKCLDETGWSWEGTGEAGYRVHVTSSTGSIGRVEIRRAGAGGLRVSSSTALRADDLLAREALVHFALEANRRLRVARLSVSSANDGTAHLVWDAIAPAALPVAAVLPRSIEAVGFARAETRRALLALADAELAEIYLDHRFPVKPKSVRTRRTASTSAGAVSAEAG